MSTILFVEHDSEIGGGQVVFLELLDAAVEAGLTVGAAYPKGGRLEKEIVRRFTGRVEGIEIPKVRMKNGRKSLLDIVLFSLSWIPFIRYWLRFRYYSIWYLNGGRVLLPMAIAAIFCRRHIVYHAHIGHGWLEKSLVLLLVRVGILKRVICPSDFMKNDFVAFNAWFVKPDHCQVIENPLARSFDALAFVNRFNSGRDAVFRIGVIGKVSPTKGHDVVSEVAHVMPEFHFYFIGATLPGDEVYVDRLKSTSPSNVIFIGEVSDVPGAINDLGIQISLVPSRMLEPFGLVAIESMACSCITLSSGRGGLSEIARFTGMLTFDINEPRSLEVTLRELMASESQSLSELARSQHHHATNRYALSRFKCEVIHSLTNL